MPSIDWNMKEWDRRHGWPKQGEEWSQPWGSAEAQWKHTLLPRIDHFVPCGTILEIAPGYGRWTVYLKELCKRLVLVDLSATCIAACRERFKADKKIDYYVNDGKDLAMVEDRSIDFVFSFDSLVHVELEVLEAYVRQIQSKAFA